VAPAVLVSGRRALTGVPLSGSPEHPAHLHYVGIEVPVPILDLRRVPSKATKPMR